MTAASHARAHAERIADDAAYIRSRIDIAWASLAAAQPGIKSTPTDSGGRGTSAPDEALVNAVQNRGRDAAVQTRRRINEMLVSLDRDMAWLRRVVDAWAATPSPRQPTDRDCQACGRYGDLHEHAGRKVGGLVVCKWAQDFYRDVKRLPNEDETQRHRDARTVRVRVSELSDKRAG